MTGRIINIAGFLKKLTHQIEVTVHEVKFNNMDERLNGLTIAQISDLHISNWNIDLIEHTIETLNRIKPDIVTITGDSICNGKKFMPHLKSFFNSIDARYGKFACLGNHDHSDGEDSIDIQNTYKKADFQVLMNNSACVNINGTNINFAGADDIELGIQNIEQMTKDISSDELSIFLTHNPLNFEQFAEYKPNLVLSGHTHGGQIFPVITENLYKIMHKTKYVSGFYKFKESVLYVNRGIGTALLSPFLFDTKFIINTPRIFSKPEISLFKLISN